MFIKIDTNTSIDHKNVVSVTGVSERDVLTAMKFISIDSLLAVRSNYKNVAINMKRDIKENPDAKSIVVTGDGRYIISSYEPDAIFEAVRSTQRGTAVLRLDIGEKSVEKSEPAMETCADSLKKSGYANVVVIPVKSRRGDEDKGSFQVIPSDI
jgi:hypothetical protein